MQLNALLIGLDLGTQGARAVAVDADSGKILVSSAASYAETNVADAQNEWKEQRAENWKQTAFSVLAELSDKLAQQEYRIDRALLSVDATSGTIVPVDAHGVPLYHGIMYNDGRALVQTEHIHACCDDFEQKLGYRFNASFGLPKMLWIMEEMPRVYENTRYFLHQADYMVAALTGCIGVSDYSNALKSGYDLMDDCWPAFIGKTGLDPLRLPRVIAPGQEIARITEETQRLTRLPANTVVTGGVSDGCASGFASGAVAPGQYNTTIGTTLVIKGVTRRFIRDGSGRVYCHKHPDGYWIPGGAGNVGGYCLNKWFGKEKFDEYNARSERLLPTGNLIYPLLGKGERFPFVKPDAEGFSLLKNEDVIARYAGTMEGVGFVERLCYDTLAALGCDTGDTVMIAGGAVHAPVWSQIRANILGKELLEPENIEAAIGAAMVAGTTVLGRTLKQSAQTIVRFTRHFTPNAALHARYDALYAQFLVECRRRGYLDEHL
ncbi:MAG: FGGY-family carbohydrate kinase [Clostridia bacterium]